jgi:hypothetical protein
MCDATAWNPSDRTFMARQAGEHGAATRNRGAPPTAAHWTLEHFAEVAAGH